MPREVVGRIHALAHRDPHVLQFLNRNHKPISSKDANKDNKTCVPSDSKKDKDNPKEYLDNKPNTASATFLDPPRPDHAYKNDKCDAFTGVHPRDEPANNTGVYNTV